MGELLQSRRVLQIVRIIRRLIGEDPAYIARTILLLWFSVLLAYSAGKRALGYGPIRFERASTRKRRPAPNFGAGEDALDAPNTKAVLQLSSRLAGSIDKIFLPSFDGQGWSGFCSVCKRPLQVRVADPADSVRRVEVAPGARKRFAFLVCLWGSSKDYVLGALVLGFSIRHTQTKHSLVCLHTDDVPKEHLDLLSLFWECRLVEHVEVAAARRLSTDNRIEESRFFKVFTKLRALEQIDFEKVLVMDIDLLVMSSIDDLFELPAPAALKRGMNRGKWPYKHGDDVDGATFFSGCEPGKEHSWGQGTGINAGVMLLAPSLADFLTMQAELKEPCHPGHVRGNGPEQDYLSRFFADRPWRHISVENNFQVHHMYNALQPLLDDAERLKVCKNFHTVRVVHFSGDSGVKPWTRCLQKTFGWPKRDQDEEYVQQFLSDYHSYLLWVKKDRDRWNRMERNMFEDSTIKGFSLGEDGTIYFEDENGKFPKETPPEAIEAVMDATRHFLKSWFDTLEVATKSLQRDLVEDLLAASPRCPPAPSQGDPDPWQAYADPWAGGREAKGENEPRKTGAREGPAAVDDAWQGWEGISRQKKGAGDSAVEMLEEVVRSGKAEAFQKEVRPFLKPKSGPGRGPAKVWKAILPKVRVECIATQQASHVLFSGPDGIEEESMSGQELRGLFAKDGTRAVRTFLEDEDDLGLFHIFVEGLEKGDVLLMAAIGLDSELLQKVLRPFQRGQAAVSTDVRVVAVAGVIGAQFQISYGQLGATASVS